MKKIGIYTSGGDAPGMNAAIRSVVRTAIFRGVEVVGIFSGYSGMIENRFQILSLRDMANIIQRGGTILKTGRSSEFLKPEFREQAAQNLRKQGIDGLVCIGGDGSFRGALALESEQRIPIVGVPGTIDNDIFGSDNTIGFDTAVNTALDAIDKIRDTAASHDRLFIVEVMGRNSGFIAAHVGLAGGAEFIFTPDTHNNLDQAIQKIQTSLKSGKTSSILITAEGQRPGRAYELAESLHQKMGWDAKVSILGHQQRGGSPTASDRILASRLGAAAVQTLLEGRSSVMLGTMGTEVVEVPLSLAVGHLKTTPVDLVDLALDLSN